MATPLYCRKCGTRLPSESPFCPTCGASQLDNDYTPTNLSSQDAFDKGTGHLPPGQMLRQRYRLLQAVGQGGMGAVYVAQDTQLGDRLVAVKEMSMSRLTPQELPHAIEQFKREAHLLASLHHPNLPIIYDYFDEGSRWYLVMSFIEGGTLQTSLDATPGKRLPVNEVIRIGIELCDVLDYLHTHQPQVVFRDLKPSNIMVTPKGHVFLIDFGIARHFKQEQTKDTAYYYSVGYAPPEQYGQSQTSPRSDIYSLGVTLHQMLSGHNPSSRPFQFPALHLIDPTIPMPLASLITQMLDMNEQARPASVVEVKAQLERVLIPKQIEPTKKAEIEPTVLANVEHKQEGQAKQREDASSQPDMARNSQGLWNKIDAFFTKRRVAMWLCFIIVSLLPGLWFLTNGYSFFSPRGNLISAVGAAIVGLIFLLKKNQPLVDRIGGIALVILGSGVMSLVISFISGYYYYYFYYYENNTYINLFLNILWLFVGTRFFLRRANTVGGLVFGISLIIIGVASSLFFHLLDFLSFLTLIILGIIAIIVTLRKRVQRKRAR